MSIHLPSRKRRWVNTFVFCFDSTQFFAYFFKKLKRKRGSEEAEEELARSQDILLREAKMRLLHDIAISNPSNSLPSTSSSASPLPPGVSSSRMKIKCEPKREEREEREEREDSIHGPPSILSLARDISRNPSGLFDLKSVKEET
jgi:hypothetical protein